MTTLVLGLLLLPGALASPAGAPSPARSPAVSPSPPPSGSPSSAPPRPRTAGTRTVGTRLQVATTACSGLDAREVHRLVTLETGVVTSRQPLASPLRVRLDCRHHWIRVTIEDPLTDKRVSRQVPAPPPSQPARARVAAVVASQLLLASWMELLTRTPPRTAASPPSARAALAAARRFARKRALVPARPRARRMSLAVAGTVGGVDFEHPFPLYGAHLQVGFRVHARGQVFARVILSLGRAERDAGQVDLVLGGMAVGTTWAWLRLGRVDLTASATVAGHYLHLTGLPASPDYTGNTFARIGGEADLGVGLRVRLGRFRLGLDAEAGLLFPWVTGLVVGEPAVRAYGAVVRGRLLFETLF